MAVSFPFLGVRESAINRAEGLRQSKILASEAMQIEQVNKARGKSAQQCYYTHTQCAAEMSFGVWLWVWLWVWSDIRGWAAPGGTARVRPLPTSCDPRRSSCHFGQGDGPRPVSEDPWTGNWRAGVYPLKETSGQAMCLTLWCNPWKWRTFLFAARVQGSIPVGG